MDDKDIFNIVDNINDDDLEILMNDLYIENINEDFVDNEIKEKIRKKLNIKIENEGRNNKEINNIRKNRWIKGVSGIVAAILIFSLIINFFPSVAYALEKVPIINKLVQIVKMDKAYKYDKGFENLIENGKYQEINKTVKYDNTEFTVNVIVADDSKMWISYDVKEDPNILWNIEFYNTNNKPLNWIDKGNRDKRYAEIDLNEKLEDFKMVITLYKNNEMFHKRGNEITEEDFPKYLEEMDKAKITSLDLLVELDKNIFNDSLTKEYKVEKNINSDIANIKVEKIEASLSRTKVYLNVENNNNLAKISFKNLRLMDNDNNIYFEASDKSIFDEVIYNLENGKNTIVAELYGGISNVENIKLICDKISYVKNEDSYITVDLVNKLVEDNNLGITLKNIEENTVVLNVPEGNGVLNDHNILSDNGDMKFTKVISKNPENEYLYELDNLNCDKLYFEVMKVKDNKVDGFDVKLFE
ncbi:DUF4179 domain-containing protein [Clostridium sp. DSM 100503]|uniref:DUF4179 domain-containing protein n=1 Tax=Clostridium sp. DSM 100503 TaxID=2963282 RepID=UPI002149D897|nr:DUF4179 domain-containing protein [Clostridium sp. DSM 100503]MCR1949995.1 DUF4179 domain-containing protein [Clostridium sp. DSM 100503]